MKRAAVRHLVEGALGSAVIASVLMACGSSGTSPLFGVDSGTPLPGVDASHVFDAHLPDVTSILPHFDSGGGGTDSGHKKDGAASDGHTDGTTPSSDSSIDTGSTGQDVHVPDAPITAHDSGTGTVCVAGPNQDKDGDGWTIAQGDCNDCDPNVNPGAVDVPQTIGPDGGLTPAVDSDCSGSYDPPQPCDTGLALTDVVANDGAKAIELCQFTTETPATPQQKIWGVISAAYVRANGAAFASPGDQVGIESAWGTNVTTQAGANMLAMSSGHARSTTQPNACGSESCSENSTGTAPTGFPQDNPNCPPSSKIDDDVALELTIRAPTNATGYKFSLKFYSMEFPTWVCNSYNDQFIALVTPAPAGSVNGNIAFDSMHNPVSVNLGFFNVCDPSQVSEYAINCGFGGATTCPTAPSPYCPLGVSQLTGTGFDIWNPDTNGTAGATQWLTTTSPVTPGQDFTIRFAIWDTGDQEYDSTILIDDFQWIATPGVTVGTR